jgi:hypothetical protein
VMTNDTIERGAGETLGVVARLLHHATDRAWAQADAEGPRSPMHLMGLGIYIAFCQAVAMLPADDYLDGHSPIQDDVVQLLTSAEKLTRSIPVSDETAGISALAVAICDLVREATP